MNNLYQIFGCNSKEDLYLLVKEENLEVQPLINYLNYIKGSIKNKNYPINSPEVFLDYIKNIKKPTIDSATLIFMDIKNYPLLLEGTRPSRKKDTSQAMKRALVAGSSRVGIVMSRETPEKHKEDLKEKLDLLGINVLDVMEYDANNKTYYSDKGRKTIIAPKGEGINFIQDEDSFSNFGNNYEYPEFANYYAQEEIKNKNIEIDIEFIKEKLKIGYQHNKQEHFGYIVYDQDNAIIKVGELSKGGMSASIVDPRILLREIFAINSDVKGVAVFHNHPSGKPNPSQEDLKITKRLMHVFKNFEIEYFDHFIVGKENVFSLSDEIMGFESESSDYFNRNLVIEEEIEWDLER